MNEEQFKELFTGMAEVMKTMAGEIAEIKKGQQSAVEKETEKETERASEAELDDVMGNFRF